MSVVTCERVVMCTKEHIFTLHIHNMYMYMHMLCTYVYIVIVRFLYITVWNNSSNNYLPVYNLQLYV